MQPGEGETENVGPGESIDGATRRPKAPRKAPAGGRAEGRARKIPAVDVALAAVQIKREAKLKARNMLESARGLVAKGRWKR